MINLTGKSAIVTGGARGIGKAISLTLARQGADVAFADILEAEGKETESEILSNYKVRALFIKCDLTKKEEVNQMVAKAQETFGKVDILVNNAGWEKIEIFSRLDEELWDKIIDLNYKHFLYTVKAVIPGMAARKSGRIVNIGSDAGRGGSLGEAVYSGCKGGVIAFSKTMAREMARYQVTVNCICPGLVHTPLTDSQRLEEFAGKLLAVYDNIIPLGRWAEPQDIADAVVFFTSDEACFITGQTLSVSGGLTMF